jgi:hypothetical protein
MAHKIEIITSIAAARRGRLRVRSGRQSPYPLAVRLPDLTDVHEFTGATTCTNARRLECLDRGDAALNFKLGAFSAL